MTSHDVVSRLRRLLKFKTIGHAGTLDPDATGLLIICLGKATKVSSLIAEGDKSYRIGFRLGIETDTYDSTGKVVAERPVDVNEARLKAVAEMFLGEKKQRPPIYSAVKVQGKKLYEYARRGEKVEIPERSVRIHSITLIWYENGEGEMEVTCSKGTYVRSLIHDIGQHLGAGAVTTSIERMECGLLRSVDAVSLSAIESAVDPRALVHDRLMTVAAAFGNKLLTLKESSQISKRTLRRANQLILEGRYEKFRPENEDKEKENV